jgi:hypothetical protein
MNPITRHLTPPIKQPSRFSSVKPTGRPRFETIGPRLGHP